MYYGNIIERDIANGPGIRTSLFVSGCRHHCPGCFNSKTADFKFGQPYTPDTEAYILSCLDKDYIKGLTILGGDPMEPENQQPCLELIKKVRNKFGTSKSIWVYTGAVYESLIDPDSRYRTPYTDDFIAAIDVLVDGPFILEKRDIQNVPFRGSTNQRLIDMRSTLANDSVKTCIF